MAKPRMANYEAFNCVNNKSLAINWQKLARITQIDKVT